MTLAVLGGEPRSYAYDALTAPIVQTATYSFADTAELRAYFDTKTVKSTGATGTLPFGSWKPSSPLLKGLRTLWRSRAAWPRLRARS